MHLFQGAALVLALCLDSFVAALALSTEGIRVPPAAVAVISGISAAFLAISMLAGQLLRPILPPMAARTAGFLLLAALGLTRLLDSGIKKLIRRSQTGSAKISFRFLSFDCILRIYADSTAADADSSKALTPAEAIPLSVALSLDSLAAGLGAGMWASVRFLCAAAGFSLCMGAASVALGCALGRRLRSTLDLSWLGGILLVSLAVTKLL